MFSVQIDFLVGVKRGGWKFRETQLIQGNSFNPEQLRFSKCRVIRQNSVTAWRDLWQRPLRPKRPKF